MDDRCQCPIRRTLDYRQHGFDTRRCNKSRGVETGCRFCHWRSPILMQLTSLIPIIVPGGTNPVERGWVKSLARPGGNVTGFAQAELSIIGNMLQTLKEIAPNISHVAMIYNPDNPAAAFFGRSFEDAARSLAIEPVIAHIHGLTDIERAI